MASATLTTPYSSHTSSPSPTVSKRSPILASISTSQISYSKNPIFRSLTCFPQLGLAYFSRWNGLRQDGFSISLKSLRFEKRRKCKGKGVFASLFGVGAPEALVIGVVALLVFGPKGLAEIAKNLGKTLRAFQPTIRELQEVSKEFKSTLEKEIGLDELQNQAQGNTSNMATLSSSPLSDAASENSQATATATETAAAATMTESQGTATPLATTKKDSQATASTPAAVTEDSQATAATPAVTTEDGQATAAPLAAATGDSQVRATTPVATTTKDSQPTVDLNTVQEVPAGMPLIEKSKTEI